MVRRHRVLTGERARSGQWRGGVTVRAALTQQRVYRQAMLGRRESPLRQNAPQPPTVHQFMQTRTVRQAALAAILLVPLSAAGWAFVQGRQDAVVVEPQAVKEALAPVALAEGRAVVAVEPRHWPLVQNQQQTVIEPALAPTLELADVPPMTDSPGNVAAPVMMTTSSRWPSLAVAARAMPDVWHRRAASRCVVAEPAVAFRHNVDDRNLTVATAAPAASVADETSSAFGERLATAAERQLDDVVIYNDRYVSLSYPMGDVSPLYGVCTDVIIRAYRALGIDLQTRIHAAKGGRGDRNIDHRRVAIMRRFFAAFGQTLPITDIIDDYRPGDIITYDRPQNSGSRAHVAIVSNELAPSGRPMIIHNRGWGPQLEDALFVDEITGHYRYDGRHSATKAMAGRIWPNFLKLRKYTAGRAKSRRTERAATMPARRSVTLKPKAQRRAHQFREQATPE